MALEINAHTTTLLMSSIANCGGYLWFSSLLHFVQFDRRQVGVDG